MGPGLILLSRHQSRPYSDVPTATPTAHRRATRCIWRAGRRASGDCGITRRNSEICHPTDGWQNNIALGVPKNLPRYEWQIRNVYFRTKLNFVKFLKLPEIFVQIYRKRPIYVRRHSHHLSVSLPHPPTLSLFLLNDRGLEKKLAAE